LLKIIRKINWQAKEDRKTAVFIDDSYCEVFKWSADLDARHSEVYVENDGTDISIMTFSEDKATQLQLQNKVHQLKPDRILFLLSVINNTTEISLKNFISASEAPECIILTSMTPDALANQCKSMNQGIQNIEVNSYEHLEQSLSPAFVSIYYFPLHSLHILHHNRNEFHHPDETDRVDLLIMSSLLCRAVSPITLRKMIRKAQNDPQIKENLSAKKRF
jgi:hypothetical protein